MEYAIFFPVFYKPSISSCIHYMNASDTDIWRLRFTVKALNPFVTNPLVVVCGIGGGGLDSTIINISALEGARRLIF